MIRAINGFTPNGTLSNTIAEFWQDTAPAQRINGTPLVVGDLWKKVGQEQAEWDGTNWISPFKYLSSASVFNATNASALPLNVPYFLVSTTPVANIKIVYQRVFTSTSGTVDGTNNWTIAGRYRNVSGNDTSFGSAFVYNNTSQTDQFQLLASNFVIPITNLLSVILSLTRNNAPGLGFFSHQLCYAHILG
jgi:hypothetical protein